VRREQLLQSNETGKQVRQYSALVKVKRIEKCI
jgi:hypothetical protein